jgi:pimeloyl-ACP methyl ester carboxylesterase
MPTTALPLPEEALARFPERLLVAGPSRFTYRESGVGEPVILLHGIGSSSASWMPLFNALGGHRLIAWDAPGYGGSTPLEKPRPLAADYAAALTSFLDALKLERVLLVGHSLGALMAGAFAVAQPRRVTSLLLLDPAGGYGAASAEAREKVRQGRLAMLRDLGPAGMAEQRAASLLSASAPEPALAWVRYSMSRVIPAGYEQAVHMLADSHLAADARLFTGTAMVACGSADSVTPEAGCRTIASAFHNATYVTIEGAGHASYVEAPGSVATLIRDFARIAHTA